MDVRNFDDATRCVLHRYLSVRLDRINQEASFCGRDSLRHANTLGIVQVAHIDSTVYIGIYTDQTILEVPIIDDMFRRALT